MNLRPRRHSEVEINVIPLIDVMFMLVIFFVVSTTFERKSEINLNLPEASQEYTEPDLDRVEVDVDKGGNVYVNGQALVNTQVRTIREALRDAVHDLEDPPVIINADAEVTHQAVVKVMDAARQLGLIKMTFSTQKIDDESGE